MQQHRNPSSKKGSTMSHVPLLDEVSATSKSRELLGRIQQAFGRVPNMFRAVAHSPAALAGMWGFFGALSTASLPKAIGEQIAVAVAERNACHYCLAAHTALGQQAGLTREALQAAQAGQASDPRTAAILRFALALVEQRGQVQASEVAAVRAAGLDDAEIVEVIAHVALNLYTNYVNVALAVPVDFPEVPLREVALA